MGEQTFAEISIVMGRSQDPDKAHSNFRGFQLSQSQSSLPRTPPPPLAFRL